MTTNIFNDCAVIFCVIWTFTLTNGELPQVNGDSQDYNEDYGNYHYDYFSNFNPNQEKKANTLNHNEQSVNLQPQGILGNSGSNLPEFIKTTTASEYFTTQFPAISDTANARHGISSDIDSRQRMSSMSMFQSSTNQNFVAQHPLLHHSHSQDQMPHYSSEFATHPSSSSSHSMPPNWATPSSTQQISSTHSNNLEKNLLHPDSIFPQPAVLQVSFPNSFRQDGVSHEQSFHTNTNQDYIHSGNIPPNFGLSNMSFMESIGSDSSPQEVLNSLDMLQQWNLASFNATQENHSTTDNLEPGNLVLGLAYDISNSLKLIANAATQSRDEKTKAHLEIQEFQQSVKEMMQKFTLEGEANKIIIEEMQQQIELNNASYGNALIRLNSLENDWKELQKELHNDHPGYLPLLKSACPSAFEWIGGDCLLVARSGERLNWYDARQECIALGGDLAVPSNLTLLAKRLRGETISAAWVGATSNLNNGVWHWLVSGATVENHKWADGHPRPGSWDTCAAVSRNHRYKLLQESCTFPLFYICQVFPKRFWMKEEEEHQVLEEDMTEIMNEEGDEDINEKNERKNSVDGKFSNNGGDDDDGDDNNKGKNIEDANINNNEFEEKERDERKNEENQQVIEANGKK